jgi:hypothetical protein
VIQGLDGYLATLIPALLVIATIGTTLMMLRFLFVIRSDEPNQSASQPRIALPWLLLVSVIVLMPFVLPYKFPTLLDGWPILFGIFITFMMLSFWPGIMRALPGRIPPGDMIVVFSYLYRLIDHCSVTCFNRWEKLIKSIRHRNTNQLPNWKSITLLDVEKSLAAWQVSGILFMVTGIALFIILWLV